MTTATATIIAFGKKRDRKTGQPKAYQAQIEDFKFWVQRRSVKGTPAVGAQAEISVRAIATAREDRVQFTMNVKIEKAHNATVFALPTADWENDSCLGFDIWAWSNRRQSETRCRVFISKTETAEITVGDCDRAMMRAIEKNDCEAFGATGVLVDARDAA